LEMTTHHIMIRLLGRNLPNPYLGVRYVQANYSIILHNRRIFIKSTNATIGIQIKNVITLELFKIWPLLHHSSNATLNEPLPAKGKGFLTRKLKSYGNL
jgi:hypothetical protein